MTRLLSLFAAVVTAKSGNQRFYMLITSAFGWVKAVRTRKTRPNELAPTALKACPEKQGPPGQPAGLQPREFRVLDRTTRKVSSCGNDLPGTSR